MVNMTKSFLKNNYCPVYRWFAARVESAEFSTASLYRCKINTLISTW
jgi:hypothetical protein